MSDYDPHVIAFGVCFACGNSFSFNPRRVPSIPIGPDGHPAIGGDRKPICRACATMANTVRKDSGLPLWDVSDEAYGPMPEAELGE